MPKVFIHNNRQSLPLLLLMVLLISSCRFYFKKTTDRFAATEGPTSRERGKNLVFSICAGCHYNQQLQRFTGKSLNDLPKIGGHLYSANLTHSLSHGIPPHYTDAELFYLLKTGIAKTGKFMPYMMKPMMADADINDIIVYLRSDDPALAPFDSTVGITHINLIGKTGLRFLMHPEPYNKGVPRPDEKDPVSYGRYLVGVIGCYHCHSRKVTKLDFLDPEKTKGYLQGGIKLKDPQGKSLFSPNLTPDKATGIGDFTLENFEKAVRQGIGPSGRALSPPMDKFSRLNDQQVKAIYTYLQSLPPVHHLVSRRP